MRIEAIISMLEKQPMSAKEICTALKLDPSQEKEVYEAVRRASKVLKHKGKQLLMDPPKCKNCGFEFESMNPSKCPKCKSERICEVFSSEEVRGVRVQFRFLATMIL